jgi:hypothetical protein
LKALTVLFTQAAQSKFLAFTVVSFLRWEIWLLVLFWSMEYLVHQKAIASEILFTFIVVFDSINILRVPRQLREAGPGLLFQTVQLVVVSLSCFMMYFVPISISFRLPLLLATSVVITGLMASFAKSLFLFLLLASM